MNRAKLFILSLVALVPTAMKASTVSKNNLKLYSDSLLNTNVATAESYVLDAPVIVAHAEPLLSPEDIDMIFSYDNTIVSGKNDNWEAWRDMMYAGLKSMFIGSQNDDFNSINGELGIMAILGNIRTQGVEDDWSTIERIAISWSTRSDRANLSLKGNDLFGVVDEGAKYINISAEYSDPGAGNQEAYLFLGYGPSTTDMRRGWLGFSENLEVITINSNTHYIPTLVLSDNYQHRNLSNKLLRINVPTVVNGSPVTKDFKVYLAGETKKLSIIPHELNRQPQYFGVDLHSFGDLSNLEILLIAHDYILNDFSLHVNIDQPYGHPQGGTVVQVYALNQDHITLTSNNTDFEIMLDDHYGEEQSMKLFIEGSGAEEKTVEFYFKCDGNVYTFDGRVAGAINEVTFSPNTHKQTNSYYNVRAIVKIRDWGDSVNIKLDQSYSQFEYLNVDIRDLSLNLEDFSSAGIEYLPSKHRFYKRIQISNLSDDYYNNIIEVGTLTGSWKYSETVINEWSTVDVGSPDYISGIYKITENGAPDNVGKFILEDGSEAPYIVGYKDTDFEIDPETAFANVKSITTTTQTGTYNLLHNQKGYSFSSLETLNLADVTLDMSSLTDSDIVLIANDDASDEDMLVILDKFRSAFENTYLFGRGKAFEKQINELTAHIVVGIDSNTGNKYKNIEDNIDISSVGWTRGALFIYFGAPLVANNKLLQLMEDKDTGVFNNLSTGGLANNAALEVTFLNSPFSGRYDKANDWGLSFDNSGNFSVQDAIIVIDNFISRMKGVETSDNINDVEFVAFDPHDNAFNLVSNNVRSVTDISEDFLRILLNFGGFMTYNQMISGDNGNWYYSSAGSEVFKAKSMIITDKLELRDASGNLRDFQEAKDIQLIGSIYNGSVTVNNATLSTEIKKSNMTLIAESSIDMTVNRQFQTQSQILVEGNVLSDELKNVARIGKIISNNQAVEVDAMDIDFSDMPKYTRRAKVKIDTLVLSMDGVVSNVNVHLNGSELTTGNQYLLQIIFGEQQEYQSGEIQIFLDNLDDSDAQRVKFHLYAYNATSVTFLDSSGNELSTAGLDYTVVSGVHNHKYSTGSEVMGAKNILGSSTISPSQVVDGSLLLNMLFRQNLKSRQDITGKFELYGKVGYISGTADVSDDLNGELDSLINVDDLDVSGVSIIIGGDYSMVTGNEETGTGGLNIGGSLGYVMGDSLAIQFATYATYVMSTIPIYIHASVGTSKEIFEAVVMDEDINVNDMFVDMEAGYILSSKNKGMSITPYIGATADFISIDQYDDASESIFGVNAGLKLSAIIGHTYDDLETSPESEKMFISFAPFIDLNVGYKMVSGDVEDASALLYAIAAGADLNIGRHMGVDISATFQSGDNLMGYGVSAGLKYKI